MTIASLIRRCSRPCKVKGDGADPATIEYKIGEIFGELRNKFRSGYILRDVIEQINLLQFNTQEARHELSSCTDAFAGWESGKNAGEYYTPRPLIRAMIKWSAQRLARPYMTALWVLLAALRPMRICAKDLSQL